MPTVFGREHEVSAGRCVLKASDGVGEARQPQACCASDGGWPSGLAGQDEIPNHRKLRRSRALVVSVAAKGPLPAGQVGSLAAHIDEHLLRWAMQKFKRLRRRPKKAWEWLHAARRREPRLFAHWCLLPLTDRRPVGAV